MEEIMAKIKAFETFARDMMNGMIKIDLCINKNFKQLKS
jgi:hypothetical protein